MDLSIIVELLPCGLKLRERARPNRASSNLLARCYIHCIFEKNKKRPKTGSNKRGKQTSRAQALRGARALRSRARPAAKLPTGEAEDHKNQLGRVKKFLKIFEKKKEKKEILQPGAMH